MKDGVATGVVCVDLGSRGTILWEVPTRFKHAIATAGPQAQVELQSAFEVPLKVFLLTLSGIIHSGETIAAEGLRSLMRRLAEVNEDQIILLTAAKDIESGNKSPEA